MATAWEDLLNRANSISGISDYRQLARDRDAFLSQGDNWQQAAGTYAGLGYDTSSYEALMRDIKAGDRQYLYGGPPESPSGIAVTPTTPSAGYAPGGMEGRGPTDSASVLNELPKTPTTGNNWTSGTGMTKYQPGEGPFNLGPTNEYNPSWTPGAKSGAINGWSDTATQRAVGNAAGRRSPLSQILLQRRYSSLAPRQYGGLSSGTGF